MSEEIVRSDYKVVPVFHLELVPDREVSYNGKASTIEQAAEVFHKLMDRSPVEVMYVLYLNSASDIVGAEQVGLGEVESVTAPLTTLFRGAIHSVSPQIIAAHFHPSGDAKPSDQDLMFTDEMLHMGEHLGIRVRDHLVVAPGTHYSIRGNWSALIEDFKKRKLQELTGGPSSGFLDRLREEVGKMLAGGKEGISVLDIPIPPPKKGDPKANLISDPENTLSYLYQHLFDKTTV